MSCLGWTCDHRGTCCQRRRRQSVKYHHRGHVEYGRRRDRYPMIRLRSAHRQWRRRRMVDGCSCSSQCELEWQRQGGWGPWKRLASCRWHLKKVKLNVAKIKSIHTSGLAILTIDRDDGTGSHSFFRSYSSLKTQLSLVKIWAEKIRSESLQFYRR